MVCFIIRAQRKGQQRRVIISPFFFSVAPRLSFFSFDKQLHFAFLVDGFFSLFFSSKVKVSWFERTEPLGDARIEWCEEVLRQKVALLGVGLRIDGLERKGKIKSISTQTTRALMMEDATQSFWTFSLLSFDQQHSRTECLRSGSS